MIVAMQRFVIPVLAALLLLGAALHSSEAADNFRGDGVRLRLAAAPPGADGRMRAALFVDLAPGWKTYWLDPGDAGIPPSLDLNGSAGLSDIRTLFPAPVRFQEGDGASSIGYVSSFAVAIEGTQAAPGSGTLDLRVMLGLCRELCVPVSAELALDLGAASTRDGEVAAAFAALPRASGAGTGIGDLRLSPDGKELRVDVAPAALAEEADLFVAAPGWIFGPPVLSEGGRMVLPVLRRPRKAAVPVPAEVLLLSKDGPFRATATLAPPGS